MCGTRITLRIRNFWRECKGDLLRWLSVWVTRQERLESLQLWSLEERRNRSELIEVFKMIKGYTKCEISEFFLSWIKDVKVLEGTVQNYIRKGTIRI